jgi:hypothetical protein
MIKMKMLFLGAVVGAFISQNALAIPTPLGPAETGAGDGLNARWVNTVFSPHSVADALAALALGPGDAGYVGEASGVTPWIDFEDGDYGGELFTGTDLPLPLGGDDNFAVSFSGFINIKQAGTYSFRSFTDDGFRLTIGSEIVSIFDADRGPGTTIDSVNLAVGLYSFEFIGWEQGGQFVNELAWITSGQTDFTQPGSANEAVFFTTHGDFPIPEPMTAALFGFGLILLGVYRQRI